MKFFIALLISMSPSVLISQLDLVLEWNFGGSDLDRGYSFIFDEDDNTYVVAGSSGSSDFDLDANLGGSDFWIIKVSTSGEIIWSLSLGGNNGDVARKILQMPDGGYLVGGYSDSDDGDFLDGYGSVDSWLVKINSDGQLEWSNNYGGTGNDFIVALDIMSDGNIVFGGYTSSSDFDVPDLHGLEDGWIGVISSSGNLIWSHNYGGSDYDGFSNLVVTDANEIIAIGNSSSDDFDLPSNAGYNDIWILKVDEFGITLNSKLFGSTGFDYGKDILLTPDGDVVITGYSDSNSGIFSGNHGLFDAYVLRIDENLDFQWLKTFGGTSVDLGEVISNTPGNSFLIGGLSYSADIDLPDNFGGSDAWLLEIDPAGAVLQTQNFGGSMNDFIFDICFHENLLSFVGGSESSDGQVALNYGDDDIWLVETDPGYSGLAETKTPKPSLSIFPNPVTSQIRLSLNGKPVVSGRIRIFNESGMLLLEKTATSELDVSFMSSGIYYLQYSSDAHVFQRKFLRL